MQKDDPDSGMSNVAYLAWLERRWERTFWRRANTPEASAQRGRRLRLLECKMELCRAGRFVPLKEDS